MIGRRHDYSGSWATGFVSPSVHAPATPQLTAQAKATSPGTKVWLFRPAPFWVRHVASTYRCGWQQSHMALNFQCFHQSVLLMEFFPKVHFCILSQMKWNLILVFIPFYLWFKFLLWAQCNGAVVKVLTLHARDPIWAPVLILAACFPSSSLPVAQEKQSKTA